MSYLDRNQAYVEQTQKCMKEVMHKMKKLLLEKHKEARLLMRSESEKSKEEYQKLYKTVFEDHLFLEKINGGLNLFLALGCSNSERARAMPSRHSIAIFNQDNIEELLNLYDRLSEIPNSFGLQSSKYFHALFASIIE